LPKVTPTGTAWLDLDRHLHDLMAYDRSTRDFAPLALAGSRHMLSAPRAGWVEPTFGQPFRAWLAETEGLALSGEGTLLVVWPGWQMSLGWAPALVSDVPTCLQRAERVCRI
jgi:hypothetical protein